MYTSTSVSSDDSHDASDEWPLDDIQYSYNQEVEFNNNQWTVVGIRYNPAMEYWEYLLTTTHVQFWTHADEISTIPESIPQGHDHAETWPIHHIRFAPGEMVRLTGSQMIREVIGIRYDDLPAPLQINGRPFVETGWWYTCRRHLNHSFYDTDFHSVHLHLAT